MIDQIKSNKIQVLRAIAIISVVLIHTCPSGMYQVVCRPFINIGVATFLFLSGYLTKDNLNIKQFYKKRFLRVFIPYLIWTFIYTGFSFIDSGFSFKKLLLNIFLSKSAVHMYYILVYIELMLLTPLIFKLVKSKYRLLGLFISPLFIILIKYVPLIFHIQVNDYFLSIENICCFVWFSYYYFGIMIGNKLLNYNVEKSYISYIYI